MRQPALSRRGCCAASAPLNVPTPLLQAAHEIKEHVQAGIHKVGEALHMTSESAKDSAKK